MAESVPRARQQSSDRDAHDLLGEAVRLLAAIAEECEALNADLAADTITQKQARVRVQNVHGIAVTPQVEGWVTL